MTVRPTARTVLAATAATTAVLLSASSGAPALAAAAAEAKGTGTSSLQVLTVTAGGHTLALGGLQLISDTVSGSALARITVTPLVADGTIYGEQVITPAESPVDIAAVTSPAALAGFASLTSPAFTATATDAPATQVSSSSLGSISLLGLSVPLNGGVSVGSAVSATSAAAQKTVTVQNLQLPSIAAILGQLGLDLSKLPVGTLGTLVDQLDLVTGAIATAQGVVDTAQAAADAGVATVNAAALTLVQAQGTQTTATNTLTSATAALTSSLALIPAPVLALYPAAGTIAGYAALAPAGVTAVETAVPGTAAAYTSYTDAQSALTAANAAVALAQTAVDTAQAALAGLVATLTTALAALDALATAVLDGTPLVSLDSLSITSKAVSTSASPGGQTAEVTGGQIQGLHVLGTDVLDAVLGTSTVDVVDLVGGVAETVTGAIGDLTGTLSSVLSSLPGLALDIPAPEIALLTKTTSTSISGGYGRAIASVQGLRITIPAITLPTSLALPGAIDLPALAGVTQAVGSLTSAPVSLELATLADQSAFAPAVVAGPGTPGTPGAAPTGPPLAATGLPVGVAVLSLLLIGGALVVRRRSVTS